MSHDIGVRLISSQRRFDMSTIIQKQCEEDYSVYVAVFFIGDDVFGMILDGHHALQAAERNGFVPEWDITDFALITEEGTDVALWLEDVKIDSEYYDWETGEVIEGYLKEIISAECVDSVGV